MALLERILDLERGALDLETGSFPMVLATEGEASDGHILSIKGGTMPERMPLLFGHRSEPQIPSLGSVTDGAKGSKGGLAVLRATGTINLNGDDPLAATRRGIAQLVADGDLHAVSIRWDGIESTRRTSLPKSHKFHVSENDESEARWGLLFEKWAAREGSIVAIGADPKALIGRAQNSSDGLERLFFRVLGEQSPSNEGQFSLNEPMRVVTCLSREHEGEAFEDHIPARAYDAIWEEFCESLRATAAIQDASDGRRQDDSDGDREDGDDGRRDAALPDGEVRAPANAAPVRETPRNMANLSVDAYQRLFVDTLSSTTARLIADLTGRKVK